MGLVGYNLIFEKICRVQQSLLTHSNWEALEIYGRVLSVSSQDRVVGAQK